MTSVIVPIRNAERYLTELLESLAAQDYDGPWEVVAVDNGSTDRSVAMVEAFTPRLPVTLVHAGPQPNLALARNVGVAAARGSKLLFVDADDTVGAAYVSRMSAALDAHQFVTSRIDSQTLNAAWVQQAHGPAWQEQGINVFYDFMPAAGANVGIRRTAFDAVGGFAPALNGAEDVGFSWKARSAGLDLAFVSDAVYRYRYRDSLGGLVRQTVHWGMASVRLYMEFREAGMPRRTLRAAAADWFRIAGDLVSARSRAELAPVVVRAGLCAGRLRGSLRYRQRYF